MLTKGSTTIEEEDTKVAILEVEIESLKPLKG